MLGICNMKNAAVIGYGGMGQWHVAHMEGLSYFGSKAPKSDVVRCAGIYDIDPKKEELARLYGVNVYSSLDELLSDESVEIVVIAVPNDKHEELTVKCLEAGKNVICEKPVTLGIESLERMIATAERCKRVFCVHQNRRWDDYYVTMWNVVKSGIIGNVVSMETRVHGSNGIPGDWRKVKAQGGGMLYDWGVHMIDQALWMNGYDVDRVFCHLDYLTDCEVDDGCFIDIFLKSGIRCRVEICTYNFISLPLMYVRGTDGTAVINDWQSDVEVVQCTEWMENDIKPVKTASGLSKTMAPRSERSIQKYSMKKDEVFVHDYYRNFCDAVDGKSDLIITHDQMRMVLKVIDAAFKSAETGEVVRF